MDLYLRIVAPRNLFIKFMHEVQSAKSLQFDKDLKGARLNGVSSRVGLPNLISVAGHFHMRKVLRSEIPSGICTKLCTIIACSHHIYAWCCSPRTSRSW